jgi:hypothetical protein
VCISESRGVELGCVLDEGYVLRRGNEGKTVARGCAAAYIYQSDGQQATTLKVGARPSWHGTR